MRNIVICCFVVLFSVLAFSQEIHGEEHAHLKATIVGFSEEKEEPLINASAFWLQAKKGAAANTDGVVELDYPKSLPDQLVFSYAGYKSDTLKISEAKNLNIKVILYPDGMLDEVVVKIKEENSSILIFDEFNIERMNSGELRKAACCNLGEAFETNASVDVNVTDAVSGAKRIQMLGLDGVYSQIQFENVPLIRGLSSSYGLNFIPGTWVNSIQITKGTGSVANGYESVAGLINLELQKPDEAERLFINAYGNIFGRGELNIHSAHELNKKWSTMIFAHAAGVYGYNDRNKDGFADIPKSQTYTLFNRWKYFGEFFRMQFGVKGLYDSKLGGQINSDQPNRYVVRLQNVHLDGFAKMGILMKKRQFGSLGLIFQGKYHAIQADFGPSRPYDATQKKFYFNAIYNDIIGNTFHNIRAGASFVYDQYDEQFEHNPLGRTEIVPGAFIEYTYKKTRFSLVTGLRGDYHNLYGFFFTPRLHLKWNITENNALRLTGGRGMRVPNVYADNMSRMASSRIWQVASDIKPEDAINAGITFTQKFKINGRPGSVSVDYFYTHFLNQLVVDLDADPQKVVVSNLVGKSYSNSFQFELSLEAFRGFEIKAAYKFYDVKATFGGELNSRAMIPQHRALLNIGYTTRNKKWKFDATGSLIGKKRLPYTGSNPIAYQRPNYSKIFGLLNAQVTYVYKDFEVYIGGENLTNYIQENAIVAADNPTGPYFDASMIWAPVSGVNVYLGIRYSIPHKKSE